MSDEVLLPAFLAPNATPEEVRDTLQRLLVWAAAREPLADGPSLAKFITNQTLVDRGLVDYSPGAGGDSYTAVPVTAAATSGVVANLPAISVYFEDVAGNTPEARFRVRRDGTMQTRAGSGGTWETVGNWYTGGTSTIGDNYYLRVTKTTAPLLTSGTLNSWQAISTDREYVGSVSSVIDREWVLALQISMSPTGATIDGTGQATLAVSGT